MITETQVVLVLIAAFIFAFSSLVWAVSAIMREVRLWRESQREYFNPER